MSQTDSICAKVQLKSPPEKVCGFFRNNVGDLVHLFPDEYKSFELVEGENICDGSVLLFKFHVGNQLVTEKYLLRVVDDVKKYIIFEAVEGDALKHYKVLRFKLEAVNGGLNKVGERFAKWTVEFEKANKHVPPPENYLELAAKVTKGIDAYFSKN